MKSRRGVELSLVGGPQLRADNALQPGSLDGTLKLFDTRAAYGHPREEGQASPA